MKSKTIKIILVFTLLSLILLFLTFYLIEFANFKIPQLIPGVDLSTYGILILISYILVFIFQQKQLLKSDNDTSVLELVTSSTIVALLSQLVYFLIREYFFFREGFFNNLLTILIATVMATILLSIIAISIAFEIKKVKGIWKHIPTVVLFLFIFLTRDYIKTFKW